MSRCRSCQTEIVWAETEHGKRMPVDAEPDPERGSIVLREREGEAPLAIAGVGPEAFPGEPLHSAHFATCPDAKAWRR